MNKVLLVDDERFVRQGLLNLIDWEKCGFQVCAEADNGKGALQQIEQTNPDLVITDIRMPVLDGIELIRQTVEERNLDTKFIILSGYNDFKYAQKAVRYGVYDFILKPIEKEELEETLIQLSTSIQKEKAIKQTNEKVLITNRFEEIISGKVEQSEALLEMLNLNKASKFYYIIIEINGSDLNEEYWLQLEKVKIEELIGELSNGSPNLPFRTHQRNSYGLLVTDLTLNRFMNSFDIFIEKLQVNLQKKLDKHISIYIGDGVDSLSELSTSMDSANFAMQYKYSSNDNKPIYYNKVKDSTIIYAEMDTAIYQKLIVSIEENHRKDTLLIIDQMFEEFQNKLFAPEAIKTSINRCVHSVTKTIKNMEGDEKNLSSLQIMIKWHQYSWTFEQLKKIFSEFVLEATEYLVELRKQNGKGDIQKVKKFIESNFHNNISLKSIANTFFMNPVYMGQLFKKAYGMYFKEYLLQVRIEEAKKHLRQTNLRIYEIAEKVGFQSPDYFVTQFEKIENLTPTEYRNQILQQSNLE